MAEARRDQSAVSRSSCFSPGSREPVELCAARVLGLPPLGVEPAGALQALQRGEQGAGVHFEDSTGNLLNAAGDAEAVQRLEAEGLQDQHVECALDDVSAGIAHGKDASKSSL